MLEFLEACRNNNTAKINKFLPCVNLDFEDMNGYTPLIWATIGNLNDLASLLIENGANVNYQTKGGMTALIWSSIKGYNDIASILINNGAKLNLYDRLGGTALIHAAELLKVEVIELLINSGADVDIQNKKGESAYDKVVKRNIIDVMYLLNKNIIHQQDERGATLLMNECRVKNEHNVLFLYEHGADFFLENNDGVSAFDILNKRDLPPALEALKEKLILEKMTHEECDVTLAL